MNGKRDIFLKVSRHVNRKSNDEKASKHTVNASPPPFGTEARRYPGTEVEREGVSERERKGEGDKWRIRDIQSWHAKVVIVPTFSHRCYSSDDWQF